MQVWDFESIDSADITDKKATFEIEPMVEIKVGSEVSLKSLARSVDADTPTLWYGQDAAGAIWKMDIVVSHTVSEGSLGVVWLCLCWWIGCWMINQDSHMCVGPHTFNSKLVESNQAMNSNTQVVELGKYYDRDRINVFYYT